VAVTERSTTRFSERESLPALRYVGAVDHFRTLARVLATLLVVVPVALAITPWQQNISASGDVIAYAPEERIQDIHAPIDGRVQRWAVQEGSEVEAGDVLVEMADNDPELMQRLDRERDAIVDNLRAAESKVLFYEGKVAGLESTRTNAVEAARLRIDVADEKIAAAEQALQAAEATRQTAQLNHDRRTRLNERGLASDRDFELAELALASARADADRASATLRAERSSRRALEADLRRTDADFTTKIQEARAELEDARSSEAKARAELAKMDVAVARQARQVITAPIAGTVFSIVAGQGGELIKAGTTVAVLVPRTTKDVVELFVDGRDVPLISAGRPVRLQFEGWPALQFAGWPSIAVGTFGGRVLLVDATGDESGRFRILVEEDPEGEPWPDRVFLRQGTLANGWVLLDQVPLGYELWRQFNGFPPTLIDGKPVAKVKKKVGL
jgi:multidrug resistance efflux pump